MSNPLQPLLELIPKPFRNRYLLVLLFFGIWMLVFDKHDLITQWRLQRTLNKLEQEKTFYTEEIKEAERARLNLDRKGEEIARERYFMSKPGEDVYIIEEKE
ncbi:MAG: septum formation initiator family protein [Lewinellaceae bacterium]|nr:septum formation initiator family protein [Lewinellaceae bacterium]